MNHCPYCGDEIEIGLETCPHCGEPLAKTEKPGTPGRIKIARPFHPFAVMAYIVILSGLIVFLQTWQKGPAKAKPQPAGEPAASAPKPAAPAPKDVVHAGNLTESDRKYMEIFMYEKSLAPIFAVVSDVDSFISQKDLKPDGSNVQNLFQKLNDAGQKADALQTPSGLGFCMSGVKTSVDQAKAALNAFWNYQSTRADQHKDAYQQNLLSFRSQKNSCLDVISNLKKELEPILSHRKNNLEKFALTYDPNPPAPQPEQPLAPGPGAQPGATAQPAPALPEPVPVPEPVKKLELREKKTPRNPAPEPVEPNPAPEPPDNLEEPPPPMELEEMQQEQQNR